MAEHRWDTAPSAPRLSPSRRHTAGPDDAEGVSGGPGPSDDPAAGQRVPPAPPRRWLLSFRAAVLAVCLLVGAAASLAVFKGGGTPAEISSVELDRDGSAAAVDGSELASSPPAGTGTGAAPARGPGAGDAGAGRPDADEAGGSPGQPTAPAVLVIHVAGAVPRPGVVRVPAGSRTADAVDAAGGAMPDADLTAVNLAAPLQDGTMVVVPRVGDPAVHPPPGPDSGTGSGTGTGTGTGTGPESAGGGAPAALININTASVQELDGLPRVGPVIAERIIAWREDHGSFVRPEDIDAVPGIGEAMLAALLPLITV